MNMQWAKYIIWIIISIPVFSDFHSAEQLYLNKSYIKAKNIYDATIEARQNNFSINYNLASTFYRLNDSINAKKYYLKALKIKPNNSDTHHNLSILNTTFVDQQFIEAPYKRAHIFGLNKTVAQNIILIISMLVFMMVYKRITKQISTKFDRIGLVGVIIWFIMASSAIIWESYDKDYGIIVTEKAQVYSGPSKTQKGLFYVHQGAEFNVIKKANYWMEVQFVNGLKGWVEGNKVTII